jgi:hypothetical protein
MYTLVFYITLSVTKDIWNVKKWVSKVSGELHGSSSVALEQESQVHIWGWVGPDLDWTLKRGWSEQLLAQRHSRVWVSFLLVHFMVNFDIVVV